MTKILTCRPKFDLDAFTFLTTKPLQHVPAPTHITGLSIGHDQKHACMLCIGDPDFLSFQDEVVVMSHCLCTQGKGI